MVNAADLAPPAWCSRPAASPPLCRGRQPAAVQRFSDWTARAAEQPGMHGVRVETLDSGRPRCARRWTGRKILSLVALLAALLSAVAVALAARGFANEHLDAAALLRVLGQSQRSIAGAYAFEFALVGLFASALGVLLGFAVHHVFVWLLAGLVQSGLPAASLWPVVLGVGVGLTLMCAFGLPPVLQLAQVPPLRVLRRDLGPCVPRPSPCWAWAWPALPRCCWW